jgi:uncharacterized phage-like protein YoqJ
MVDFAKLLNQPPKPPPIVPQLVIAITGHRPHKLASPGTVTATKPNGDGYEWGNPLRVALRERIREETERLLARPREPRCKMSAMHLESYLRQVKWADGFTPGLDPIALSGVALGIDQDACGVWFRMGLPYIAVIPFPGQEYRWPASSRETYAKVLAKAAGIVYVSPNKPTSDHEAGQMLLKRDEWLCCACDELIAVWDGSRSGTSKTVRYYEQSCNRAVRIDPREVLGAAN